MVIGHWVSVKCVIVLVMIYFRNQLLRLTLYDRYSFHPFPYEPWDYIALRGRFVGIYSEIINKKFIFGLHEVDVMWKYVNLNRYYHCQGLVSCLMFHFRAEIKSKYLKIQHDTGRIARCFSVTYLSFGDP